jgi:hypothetical protein
VTLVVNWRRAIAQQLLTPAPDTRAVAWKKAAMVGPQHEYIGLSPRRIELAIADDLAFLAAHPIRQPKGDADEAKAPRS